ncbi:cysteine desulfurase family protein [Azospirillum tabaci]|uniref:cysteine desulfurase family protein n=1 Tax=Azospirillum tabaci TaxID=2752310 RepID=UPI001FE6E080|nr:aminotransferase class V-fold PLP-dependent enzyme [Azospirillum tabaci]
MDYQATTPVDRRVYKAMEAHFLEQYGNPHAADHAFGWQAESAVSEARWRIGAAIGADADEIVFTSGATESNNLALLGIARAMPAPRRRVLVSAIEHKCVLGAARALSEEGFEIVTIPCGNDGIVDPATVAQVVDRQTALVSVMTVNNEIGTEQPIAEIAALCRSVGAVFHTDAAQALAVQALDVRELGVDLLSLSAHKVYGPKGIGALFIRRDLPVRPRPIIHGGGQEGGLRSGTLPTPLCVGFGEACALLSREREAEIVQIRTLRDRLLSGLQASIPGLCVNGSLAHRHPGNLNVRIPGVEASLLLNAVQPRLAASAGAACTSGIPEPSHVLRSIGLPTSAADESIRLSLGRFTTEQEIEAAVLLLSAAAEEIRRAL